MSKNNEKILLDSVFTRRHFLQLAASTTAAMALNPFGEAFASCFVGELNDYVNLAILADIHYYAPELGTTGSAFQDYLAGDRKMLVESKTTLASAIHSIKQSNAQIVLICGDLTKDGELLCHQQVAQALRQLTSVGKKVFVINGNHDIYNPAAYSYSGASQTRVANVGPKEFKSIYSEFGYSQAIATDPNSLSYVVEPVSGLRIVIMDSCKYAANNSAPVTSGALSDSRLSWIKTQIQVATARGKTIIAMMHHGIVPHFSAQPVFFSDYVLDNYSQVGETLSSLGLKVVFTGHFHAQNISKATFGSNTLMDIETGSLVTYPIPYRFIQLTPDRTKFKITSSKVTSTDYPIAPLSFQDYAKNFTAGNMKDLIVSQFAAIIVSSSPSTSLAQATAMAAGFAAKQVSTNLTVSDLFVNAMLAHYAGDVNPDAQTKYIYQSMATSTADQFTPMLGRFLVSIGARPALGGDNNLNVNFTTANLYNGML